MPSHRLRPALRGRGQDPAPAADQRPTRTDTIFDLASLTKLFTAIVVMQQVEAGRVELDAPVTRYLSEFAAGDVTVRQL